MAERGGAPEGLSLPAAFRSPMGEPGGILGMGWQFRLTGSCTMSCGGSSGEILGRPSNAGRSMAELEHEGPAFVFKLGDRVQFRRSGDLRRRIVEMRGPLGPGGAQIYR